MDVKPKGRALKIAGIIAAVAIVAFVILDQAGRAELGAESADNACREAQVAVEDKLHARDLSFVTDCNDDAAKKQAAGYWAVGGKVDDKSGTRWLWLVKLTYTGGDDWTKAWRVDDVEMAPTAS